MFSTWYGLWQLKRFSKKTQSEKVLRDKAFKVVSDQKDDGYPRGLALIV